MRAWIRGTQRFSDTQSRGTGNVGFGPHVLIPFFVPSMPTRSATAAATRARALLLQLHDEDDDDDVPNACPTCGLQQQQHCVRSLSQSKVIFWQKNHFEWHRIRIARVGYRPDTCYAPK